MTKRKIVLLSLIAIFTILYIIQLAQSGKNTVQTITLEEDITSIRLSYTNGEQMVLTKQQSIDENKEAMWILEDGTQVETFPLTRMAGQLNDVRVLAHVSSSANAERYDLQEGKALIIEALNGQKVIRTITVGKAATTTSQTYAIIDNTNDIVLVSGDLHDIFDKTREELEVKPEEVETTE